MDRRIGKQSARRTPVDETMRVISLFKTSYHDCILAGILFCLAFFTKQQTVPFLLGCLVWAAGMARSRKAALITAATALALGLALADGMQLATGGFLRDVVVYPAVMSQSALINSREFLIARLETVWEAYHVQTLLFIVYAAWALARRKWELPLILRWATRFS